MHGRGARDWCGEREPTQREHLRSLPACGLALAGSEGRMHREADEPRQRGCCWVPEERSQAQGMGLESSRQQAPSDKLQPVAQPKSKAPVVGVGLASRRGKMTLIPARGVLASRGQHPPDVMGGSDGLVRLRHFLAAMGKVGPSVARGRAVPEHPALTWDDVGGLHQVKVSPDMSLVHTRACLRCAPLFSDS